MLSLIRIIGIFGAIVKGKILNATQKHTTKLLAVSLLLFATNPTHNTKSISHKATKNTVSLFVFSTRNSKPLSTQTTRIFLHQSTNQLIYQLTNPKDLPLDKLYSFVYIMYSIIYYMYIIRNKSLSIFLIEIDKHNGRLF